MIRKTFYEDALELKNITLDLSEKKNSVSEYEHIQVVERLIKFFNLMKSEQNSVKDIWKPAGEWKNYNDEKDFFYQAITNNNTRKVDEILKNFWRNELGLIVKEYARFDVLQKGETQTVDDFLSSIYRNYIIWKDLYNLPTDRLKINKYIGNPWGSIIDGVMATPKAIRYHHNAKQIKNLLLASDGHIISEIGAGYGALCYYLMNENCGIKYIDFDLPETLVLAAYYLLLNFPDKKIFLYGEKSLKADLSEEYDIMLLPNYAIELFPDKSTDVFFNSFSLSEMPAEANAEYIMQISRLTKSYFLHNNMDRKGVFNRGFERIPGSEYPLDEEHFVLLSKNYDVFHSHFGDYKEFLYKIR